MTTSDNAKYLRFVPELRSADFERSRNPQGRVLIYGTGKGDLDESSMTGDVRRVNPFTAWTLAFRQRWTVVELAEPLWLRALLMTYSIGLAVRLSDRLTGRRTLVVTYAIENNDPARLFRLLPTPVRQLVAAVIRLISSVVYDRIAFGSPAAERCYRSSRVLPSSCDTAHFLELQPLCDCRLGEVADEGSVVFIGALEIRKGVPDLLAAWATLPAAERGWTLTIVGSGPRMDDVRLAAKSDATIDLRGRLGRDDIHAVLRLASVLVLPSRHDKRWCEQIGLSIVEALSHGCRIVSTPDTGLASWLDEQGNVVLPPGFTFVDIAAGIVRAIETGPSSDPGKGLPIEDNRLLAEDWMYAPTTAGRPPVQPRSGRVDPLLPDSALL
jgi:glycosyltransferase involved in cell wall biosynthesis